MTQTAYAIVRDMPDQEVPVTLGRVVLRMPAPADPRTLVLADLVTLARMDPGTRDRMERSLMAPVGLRMPTRVAPLSMDPRGLAMTARVDPRTQVLEDRVMWVLEVTVRAARRFAKLLKNRFA